MALARVVRRTLRWRRALPNESDETHTGITEEPSDQGVRSQERRENVAPLDESRAGVNGAADKSSHPREASGEGDKHGNRPVQAGPGSTGQGVLRQIRGSTDRGESPGPESADVRGLTPRTTRDETRAPIR
jgi:hypothetical protein